MKLRKHKRVIIKIGTNTLTDANGTLDEVFMTDFVAQMATLVESGYHVALVSSGAVRAGMAALGLDRVRSLRESQAAAAVGQGILMHIYRELFCRFKIHVGQILLVADDFRDRNRYLNARNTLFTLFEKKIVPVINENDTVPTFGIRFGNNDVLAANVAELMQADLLIILSDINGLYTADPRHDTSARIIETVRELSPEIIRSAGGSGNSFGTGGMSVKLDAARITMYAGIDMIITNGKDPEVIRHILAGEKRGTLFEGLRV